MTSRDCSTYFYSKSGNHTWVDPMLFEPLSPSTGNNSGCCFNNNTLNQGLLSPASFYLAFLHPVPPSTSLLPSFLATWSVKFMPASPIKHPGGFSWCCAIQKISELFHMVDSVPVASTDIFNTSTCIMRTEWKFCNFGEEVRFQCIIGLVLISSYIMKIWNWGRSSLD